MPHEYTTETLYHFTCGQCSNWWSYAHATRKYDLKLPSALSTLSCPHCGSVDRTLDKRSAFDDRPA